MKKIDLYDVLGALADAAVKKTADKKKDDTNAKASEDNKNATTGAGATIAEAPLSPAPIRRSFADRKTVVEMIRRHDELSRRITEEALKAAEEEST